MNGTYDIALVVASYCVAVFASYVALDLGRRIAFFDGSRERFWLAAGALTMGTGVWAMHFVGMQAFELPIRLSYSLGLTALSWGAAVAVSLLALYIISRSQLRIRGIAAGAVVMGLGICIMHYSGMLAMRMSPGIQYDPLLVGVSALIAVLASAAALFISFSLRQLINAGGRTPPPFGVVYAELRGYRGLVEKRGQDQVNLMMKALATQLSRGLRSGDTLARLSHDGFVLLVRQQSDRDVESGIAQAMHLFNSPVRGENEVYKLAWGLGSSRYPENGNSTQALVRAAMKLQRETGDGTRGAAQQPVPAMGAA